MASETKRLSISVTPEKQEKLDAIANSLDRSLSWLANQAIDHYLEIYDWQTKNIQERQVILQEKMHDSNQAIELMLS